MSRNADDHQDGGARVISRIIAAITPCRICGTGQVNEFDGVKYCTNGCTYR